MRIFFNKVSTHFRIYCTRFGNNPAQFHRKILPAHWDNGSTLRPAYQQPELMD